MGNACSSDASLQEHVLDDNDKAGPITLSRIPFSASPHRPKCPELSFTFGSQARTFVIDLEVDAGQNVGAVVHIMRDERPELGDQVSVSCSLGGSARAVNLASKMTEHVVKVEPACVISAIADDSALAFWNLQCQTQTKSHIVRPGQRIVAVNGEQGSPLKLLRSLGGAEEARSVQMSIQEPVERSVYVEKFGDVLGLDFQYANAPFSLMVTAIKDGVVLDWNVSNPDLAVKPGDRIIAVNGHVAFPEDLIRMLEDFDTLDLRVLSWPPVEAEPL
eukprot:TRINITY_DN70380_c0_g1_i1.p1 TRINITY_DN70380_c0_g1~~TRINITY_DN70380_c0_g1_i1.p1  ORF type:complete len:275 (+),score=51.05 TRINITY_DN70380_c0_g1_i1:75-899(+)